MAPRPQAVCLSVCCLRLGSGRREGVLRQIPIAVLEPWKKRFLVGRLPQPIEMGNFFFESCFPSRGSYPSPISRELIRETLVVQPLQFHTNLLLTAVSVPVRDREALSCQLSCLQYTLRAWSGTAVCPLPKAPFSSRVNRTTLCGSSTKDQELPKECSLSRIELRDSVIHSRNIYRPFTVCQALCQALNLK